MLRARWMIMALWGGLLGSTGFAAVPLEAFGQLPSVEDVAISPDGTRLAFTRTKADSRVVYITSLTDQKLLGYVDAGKVKLRGVSFADNDRLMLITSNTGLAQVNGVHDVEAPFVRIYEISSGKLFDPLAKVGVANFFIGRPMLRRLNGQTYLFVTTVRAGQGRVLAKIDLRGLDSQLVNTGDLDNFGWLLDENGEIQTAETYSASKQRWGIKTLQQGKLVEAVSGIEAIDIPGVEGFAPEGNAAWVQMMVDGHPAYRTLTLADGKLGAEVSAASALAMLIRDPYSDRIVGGVTVGMQRQYVFFDAQMKNDWQAAQRLFPGEVIELISRAHDARALVVSVLGAQHGYGYFVVDPVNGSVRAIGNAYEGVSEIATVASLVYPASDGLEIPAMLTVPNVKNRRNLPLVVLPHGGPEAHDEVGFDWWAQALAAQGYVVLQPNYRGSDLTFKLQSAGFGEWGRKMQTDVSDGVAFLAEAGLVDPQRVCIVGASYGGYAALAGVTLQTGIYRCAVSVAGISDLTDFQRSKFGATSERFGGVGMRYLDRYLGAGESKSDNKDDLLKSRSPIEHVDQVKVPVLIIHGRDDSVVPYRQSELMFKALKRANKPVQMVTLQQEDHWLSRSATRLQMLQESVKFLREYNPPD